MQSARPDYTARPGEAVRVSRDDDGSFAIGVGRLRVLAADGEDMAFVAAVVEQVGRLAHTAAGEDALRRGDAIGQPVRIVKPAPPTAPANAWTMPDDLAAVGASLGCGSTIFYDPADWPERGDIALPGAADILLAMIEQANANAAGASNPSLPDWGVRLRR